MTRTNEHLEHPGTVQRRETQAPFEGPALTFARAGAMCALRERMLASLRGDIGISLHDALRRKIRHERSSLFHTMEAEARAEAARRMSSPVLKSEYFERKPLDIGPF